MSNQPIGKSIINDNRAVSTLIGAILLFGFLIIALSVYQAESVPQQNAETEFQHSEDVKNDLVVVRNAISRAGQQNQSQFESVRLGTTYRERVIALNPPDPAGTLRTSDAYDIIINPKDDDKIIVETRFLKYQNGYNELNIEPIYYENSVLYLEPEGGNRVFFEDQNLVRENGNVVITALQRELSTSSIGRVTLELYPTEGGRQLPEGKLNVTLPTRLEGEYWSDQNLGEQEAVIDFNHINSDSDKNPYPDDVSAIKITVDSDDLEFNTVGINDYPNQGSVENENDVISDIDDPTRGRNNGLPPGAVAFVDKDGDGEYNGWDQPLTETEAATFDNDTADLVIAKDVINPADEDGEAISIEITGNNVTVQSGVTVQSDKGNDVSIDATGANMNLAGATINAGGPGNGNAGEIDLTAENGNIELSDTTLSANGDMTATPADDGTVTVTDAIIQNRNGNKGAELEVEAGDIDGEATTGEADAVNGDG